MSPEVFLIYLTIVLIVIAPLGARLYRRMTLARTQKMLRKEFESPVQRQGDPR